MSRGSRSLSLLLTLILPIIICPENVCSLHLLHIFKCTEKPVLSGHSKIDKTKILMTNGSLLKVKIIAVCSPWSILQYFWPALRDNPSWKPISVFFLSGRLRQVLLFSLSVYVYMQHMKLLIIYVLRWSNNKLSFLSWIQTQWTLIRLGAVWSGSILLAI